MFVYVILEKVVVVFVHSPCFCSDSRVGFAVAVAFGFRDYWLG